MKKILFVDRDGTLIKELANGVVENLNQLEFVQDAILALYQFHKNGYEIAVVSNQPYLGQPRNPIENYEHVNNKIKETFASQRAIINTIYTCPHAKEENCACMKPKTGLVDSFLQSNQIDKEKSIMVGDRSTDTAFAKNIGIRGFELSSNHNQYSTGITWASIVETELNIKL